MTNPLMITSATSALRGGGIWRSRSTMDNEFQVGGKRRLRVILNKLGSLFTSQALGYSRRVEGVLDLFDVFLE